MIHPDDGIDRGSPRPGGTGREGAGDEGGRDGADSGRRSERGGMWPGRGSRRGEVWRAPWRRSSSMRYADRWAAGFELAAHLPSYQDRDDVLVLGLPRGGVVTAAALAERLRVPLDVFCVRKLGVPWQPELAMGAVAGGGARVLNDDVIRALGLSDDEVEAVAERELAELRRRERRYRGDRPFPALAGRVVILVDDGVATGATARVAVTALRRSRPSWLVFAAPVGSVSALADLERVADAVACPLRPEPFDAVGLWYADFRPVTDDEVEALLAPRRPPEA